MRDLDQSRKPAADTGRDVQGKQKAAKGQGGVSSPSEPWFSGNGLKRRMSMPRLFSAHTDTIQDSSVQSQGQPPRAHGWNWQAAAVVCVTAVLVAGIGTTTLMSSRPSLTPGSAGASISQYMQDLGSWHAGRGAPGAPGDDPFDASAGWRACAMHTALPPVRLPPQPQGVLSVTAGPDPLDQLSINCSDPQQAQSCDEAAAVNAYEANMDYISAAELQEYLKAVGMDSWPSSSQGAPAPQQDLLQELDLDCEANPAACEAAAAAANSYEGTQAAAENPVEDSFAAYQAWAARQGAAAAAAGDPLLQEVGLQCGPGSSDPACARALSVNQYEGRERGPAGLRAAEESGPQYVDVSRLRLDCSDAGPDMQEECERSRGTNRYEQQLPQDEATEQELEYPTYLRTGRTTGYDIPALSQLEEDHQQEDATAAAPAWLRTGRTTGYDVPAVEGQPLAGSEEGAGSSYQQQEQEDEEVLVEEERAALAAAAAWRSATRVTGYDVVAEPVSEPIVSTAPATAADQEPVLPVRQYYKNPCNNPGAHILAKNMGNDHSRRVFYKNPLNAPSYFTGPSPEEQQRPEEQQQQAGGMQGLAAALGVGLPVLQQLLVTLLVAVCGGLLLVGGRWWQQHRQATTGFPVPEAAPPLRPARSAPSADDLDAPESVAIRSSRLLAAARAKQPRDDDDIVPEGIDSPRSRRAATPAPLGTPRALSRIGGVLGDGKGGGGGGGRDDSTRE